MGDTDLLTEEVVPLSEARKRLIPRTNGNPPHPATLWRWIHKGLRAPDGSRIRLEVTYAGRTPCTSQAAIHRFFARLTEARLSEAQEQEQPSERPETTERRLREAGLL